MRALMTSRAVTLRSWHHHLDDFLDMFEGFLLGISPRGRAIGEQGRTMGRPPILIRLNHHPEDIGFHTVPLDMDSVFILHTVTIGRCED
jgi:hypothetical protein